MKQVLRRLRPEEWLCLLFAALLAVLTTFFTGPDYGWRGLYRTLKWAFVLSMRRDIPFFSSHMAFFLLLGVGTYAAFFTRGMIRPGPEGRGRQAWTETVEFLRLLRAYLPFLACYVVYALLRDMIPHINPRHVDASLAKMELDLFGTLVCTAAYQTLQSPLMTTLLSKAYASHFYVPPLVAFLLFIRKDRAGFRNFMLAISISAMAAYLGYLLVPAGGPRYAVAEWATIRASQSGDATLRFMDFWSQTAADCFPSLHTAWTVLSAIFLFRFSKILFALYVPVGAGLITATLYFGYHYLIDLPAGALTAIGAAVAATALHRWWYANVEDLTRS